MRLSDLKGIFRRGRLGFISAENVFDDYWVVRLKPEEGMRWTPGEHGIFTIPGKKFKGRKWRVFSVASSPDEGVVMIGTRTGEIASNFKRTLFRLEPGEKVNLIGPFGWFTLNNGGRQIVMSASGVGITPVRAIAMELDKHPDKTVEILHTGKYHLFMEDLKKKAEETDVLHLHFTEDREEMKHELTRLAVKYANNASYYVSGSINAITSMKKILRKSGVKGNRIINDPFIGYRR